MLLASLRFEAGRTLDGYLQADMAVPIPMEYTGFWGGNQLPPPRRLLQKGKKHYIIRLLSFISSIVHVHPFLSGTRIMVSLGPLVTRMIPSFCVLLCCGNK